MYFIDFYKEIMKTRPQQSLFAKSNLKILINWFCYYESNVIAPEKCLLFHSSSPINHTQLSITHKLMDKEPR